MELMENGACNLQHQSYTKSVTLGKIPSEYCCHKTFQGTARLESLVIVQQRKTQTFDAILLMKKRAQFGRQHTHIKGIKNICNMENWISSQCFTFLPHEYVLPIAKRPSRVLKCSFGLSWKGSCRSSEKSIGKYQSIGILRKEEQSADVTL